MFERVGVILHRLLTDTEAPAQRFPRSRRVLIGAWSCTDLRCSARHVHRFVCACSYVTPRARTMLQHRVYCNTWWAATSAGAPRASADS